MAGRKFTATVTANALASGVVETVVQVVAATNHALGCDEVGVTFDGALPTAVPVLVVLERQDSAGTSSALTPVKGDDGTSDTLDVTAREGFSGTEPVSGGVIKAAYVHPQAGIIWRFAKDELKVQQGDRLGVTCNAPAGVNVTAYIAGEE